MDKKHVFLLIFAFVLYGYLIDIFNKPESSTSLSSFIARATQNKTHTVVQYIKTRANLLASGISISCTTVLGCIPVNFQNFFNLLFKFFYI